MRIKHYVTALSNDVVKLDREVNELLAKGYQPFGSPYISKNDERGADVDRFIACQAMVLYEEPVRPEVNPSLV
jgi:hypothetical protein